MSHVMRKHGLCHMRTTKAQISLHVKPLGSFCGCAGRVLSYLIATTEERFSRDGAHMHLEINDLFLTPPPPPHVPLTTYFRSNP